MLIRLCGLQLLQDLGCSGRKSVDVILQNHGKCGMGAFMNTGFLQRYNSSSVLAVYHNPVLVISAHAIIDLAVRLASPAESDLPPLLVKNCGTDSAEAHCGLGVDSIRKISTKAPASRIDTAAAMSPS